MEAKWGFQCGQHGFIHSHQSTPPADPHEAPKILARILVFHVRSVEFHQFRSCMSKYVRWNWEFIPFERWNSLSSTVGRRRNRVELYTSPRRIPRH